MYTANFSDSEPTTQKLKKRMGVYAYLTLKHKELSRLKSEGDPMTKVYQLRDSQIVRSCLLRVLHSNLREGENNLDTINSILT